MVGTKNYGRPSFNSPPVYTLVDSDNAGDTTETWTAKDYWNAISSSVGAGGFDLAQVRLKLWNEDNCPAGTKLQVCCWETRLQASFSVPDKTKQIEDSNLVDISALSNTTPGGWINFDFTNTSHLESKVYGFILKTTHLFSMHDVRWRDYVNNGGYISQCLDQVGTVWTVAIDHRLMYEIYSLIAGHLVKVIDGYVNGFREG